MRNTLVLLALMAPALVLADCTTEAGDAAQLACFDRLARCASLADETGRLACFRAGGQDRLAGAATLSAAPAAHASAPAAQTGTAPARAVAIEQAYPAPRGGDEPEPEVPDIEASIVSVQQDARKYRYLTLSNGHIWRETEVSRNRYKEGDAVVIRKGALNSNQLLPANGSMVRVKRVK